MITLLPYQLDLYRINERGVISWMAVSRPPGVPFSQCVSQLEWGLRHMQSPSIWNFSSLAIPYSLN